jgi:hypothetical protein
MAEELRLVRYSTSDPEHPDGVRYLSTAVEQYPQARDAYDRYDPVGTVHASANYVFPVRRKATSGHCTLLQEKFELTAPVPWPIIQRVYTDAIGGPNYALEADFGMGRPIEYRETEFGLIEGRLEQLEAAKL